MMKSSACAVSCNVDADVSALSRACSKTDLGDGVFAWEGAFAGEAIGGLLSVLVLSVGMVEPKASELPNELPEPKASEPPNELPEPKASELPNELPEPKASEPPNELPEPKASELPNELPEPKVSELPNELLEPKVSEPPKGVPVLSESKLLKLPEERLLLRSLALLMPSSAEEKSNRSCSLFLSVMGRSFGQVKKGERRICEADSRDREPYAPKAHRRSARNWLKVEALRGTSLARCMRRMAAITSRMRRKRIGEL